MLMIERTKVIPEKSYHKILYLYPAMNNTFVFLGMKGLRQDCVTHMDSKGNVLFEHTFQKPMDAFGMLSEDEAIMIETRGNCITILNLKSHQFRRIAHHFFNQQSDQANILTFAETRFLCIEEYGGYNDNRYKLSYYKPPLEIDSRPFAVYEAKDNEWNYQFITKKANQQSMVVWFKARHDTEWEFKTYQINQTTLKGSFNHYRFAQQIGVPYNMSNVQVALNSIWQVRPNQFMLVCISNKTENQINKELGVIQNNFICNVTTGQVRQAKFSFGWHHDYLIDYYNIGRFSMFRTFHYQDSKVVPSPVFYIDNGTQKIVQQQSWQCSYLHKYQFPGYDSDLLIENIYENGDCEWFQCIKKKIYRKKQVALFFLQEIYEKWDQDLIADVIELLEDECQTKFNQLEKKQEVQTHQIVQVMGKTSRKEQGQIEIVELQN